MTRAPVNSIQEVTRNLNKNDPLLKCCHPPQDLGASVVLATGHGLAAVTFDSSDRVRLTSAFVIRHSKLARRGPPHYHRRLLLSYTPGCRRHLLRSEHLTDGHGSYATHLSCPSACLPASGPLPLAHFHLSATILEPIVTELPPMESVARQYCWKLCSANLLALPQFTASHPFCAGPHGSTGRHAKFLPACRQASTLRALVLVLSSSCADVRSSGWRPQPPLAPVSALAQGPRRN